MSKNVPNFPLGKVIVYKTPNDEVRMMGTEKFIGRAA